MSLPDGPDAIDGHALVGVGCAVCAAIAYAWFTYASQALVSELGSVRFVVLSNTGSALVFTLFVPFFSLGADGVTTTGMTWLVLMAWVATVAPVFLTFEAIGRMGAGRVGLFMLLGPVVTLAAAFVVLGEVLSWVQIAGATLVVGSIGVLRWLEMPAEAPTE